MEVVFLILILLILAVFILGAVILFNIFMPYYAGDFFPFSIFTIYFICFAASLPAAARPRFRAAPVLIIFYPLVFCYLCLLNHMALVMSTALAFLFALILPRGSASSQLLFTDAGDTVALNGYKKRGVYGGFIHLGACFSIVLLAATFLFPSHSLLWQVRRFPVDMSKRTFDSPAVVSGAVTVSATKDDDALLVADFFDVGGISSPAKEAGLCEDDVVIEINGEPALHSDFITVGPDGSPVDFTILRIDENDKLAAHTFTVTPIYSEEDAAWRVGLTYYQGSYLGGSVQTLSFFYPENGRFAATAHESEGFDIDGNVSGELYSGKVVSFDEEGLDADPLAHIGTVNFSSKYGTFGMIENMDGTEYPISEKSAVRFGRASLLSAFEGGDVEQYDVFITGTYRISGRDVLTLTVTDERIIEKGGLRRGMSGSPIVQNGRIIGALSNMDAGGISAYATYAADMAHELKIFFEKE